MPRNTRAAARAQDPDIEIATDDTQTDAATQASEVINDSERPALVELTANAVDEIEVAMELKAEGKKGAKKARGTGKKSDKKAKSKSSGKPKKAPVSVQQPLDSADESSSASETAPANDIDEPAVDTPVASTHVETMEQPDSPSPESSLTPPEPVEQLETEAAQKLESLFKQPEERVTQSPVEGLAEMAPAAIEPAPASKKPAKISPKDAKAKSAKATSIKRSPIATKASTLRAKAASNPSAAKARASTLKARPSMAGKTPSSTIKARPSTLSPVKKAADEAKLSLEKKRSAIAALNTPPRPAKSTKPPTTSTFKLPGEALQEKFKAQREERLRRQEEQAQKQKDTAIRPTIPPKHTTKPRAVPDVKLNKTSASRMSMSNALKERPNGGMTPTVKKSATLRMGHRPSLSVGSGNTVKRPQGHTRSVSATSKPEIAQPTLQLTAAEKAEAAKKARAEAAERGRLASKAWAEKKQKELEAKKAAAKAGADIEAKENVTPTPTAIEAA